MAYAHDLIHPETGERLGIVHRDVSPANVLISRNGEIKLADFGLAKAASQVESTDPGVVKGKMSYLSPEAARGENVDQRADIFSVGILLYEMLTGKRLFYGDTDYQTVELVRNAKIPPIATQNPEVEPEFEEICRKALARRTEDRFQTATDLQDALAHYLFSRGLKMIQRDIARTGSRLHRGSGHPVVRRQGQALRHHRHHLALRARRVHLARIRQRRSRRPRRPGDGARRRRATGGQLHRSARLVVRGRLAEPAFKRPARYRRRIAAQGFAPSARHRQRDAGQEQPVLACRRAASSAARSPGQRAGFSAPPMQGPGGFAPMPPQPTRSHAIPRGLLLGIMAGAVVIGAVFAWLLFSGR